MSHSNCAIDDFTHSHLFTTFSKNYGNSNMNEYLFTNKYIYTWLNAPREFWERPCRVTLRWNAVNWARRDLDFYISLKQTLTNRSTRIHSWGKLCWNCVSGTKILLSFARTSGENVGFWHGKADGWSQCKVFWLITEFWVIAPDHGQSISDICVIYNTHRNIRFKIARKLLVCV